MQLTNTALTFTFAQVQRSTWISTGLTETVDKETRQNEWGFVKATPSYKTHDLQKIAGAQQNSQLEIADSCDCLVMIGHWKH